MITVAQVIEDIVRNSPLLEEGLAQRIINYSALARRIKPKIDELLLKNIQEGAIVMALKRMSNNSIRNSAVTNLFKQNLEMIVRSNLVEYTFSNSYTLINKLEQLLSRIKDQNRYFFTITQGVFETDVIISKEIMAKTQKIFDKEMLIKTVNNLSSITIRLPEENVVIPGVYYFILKQLAWEAINITEVVSTYNEFTIILSNEEVDKAFSILKKSITP